MSAVTEHEIDLESRAAELRRSFDQSFAEPPRVRRPQREDFLAIRAGDDPYAIRLAEIRGLFADRKVTRLPGTVRGFIGLVGFRGVVVPVYELPVLLGHAAAAGRLRWLAAMADLRLALAFEAFEGHLRPPPDAISLDQCAAGPRRHVRAAVRDGSAIRPIIDLAGILETIRTMVDTARRAPSEGGVR
jgi:purine-binding chemotaxis protein CheW